MEIFQPEKFDYSASQFFELDVEVVEGIVARVTTNEIKADAFLGDSLLGYIFARVIHAKCTRRKMSSTMLNNIGLMTQLKSAFVNNKTLSTFCKDYFYKDIKPLEIWNDHTIGTIFEAILATTERKHGFDSVYQKIVALTHFALTYVPACSDILSQYMISRKELMKKEEDSCSTDEETTVVGEGDDPISTTTTTTPTSQQPTETSVEMIDWDVYHSIDYEVIPHVAGIVYCEQVYYPCCGKKKKIKSKKTPVRVFSEAGNSDGINPSLMRRECARYTWKEPWSCHYGQLIGVRSLRVEDEEDEEEESEKKEGEGYATWSCCAQSSISEGCITWEQFQSWKESKSCKFKKPCVQAYLLKQIQR